MTPKPTIARARLLRSTLTPPEARLWVALRRLRTDGFHFRRQAPFRNYFLDFVCHGRRLAIEVDGTQHGEPDQARHDAIRDAVLAREGYRTLRFAAADVLGNLEGVVSAIRLALAEAPPGAAAGRLKPPPGAARHPPHEGEGKLSTSFPPPCGEGGAQRRVGVLVAPQQRRVGPSKPRTAKA